MKFLPEDDIRECYNLIYSNMTADDVCISTLIILSKCLVYDILI